MMTLTLIDADDDIDAHAEIDANNDIDANDDMDDIDANDYINTDDDIDNDVDIETNDDIDANDDIAQWATMGQFGKNEFYNWENAGDSFKTTVILQSLRKCISLFIWTFKLKDICT